MVVANGAATFVLVPGAGGSAWYWHRLVLELEAENHQAIAVELPASDDSAGLEEYADAIVAAGRGHERIVLVAQSFGGFSAPLAASRLRVSSLVFLNAMIPRPGESAAEWWEPTRHEQARVEDAQRQERPTTFDPVEDFFHDVPEAVMEEAMRLGEPPQSGTPFGQPWPLAAIPDVPTRVLVGRDDRFFPLEFQRRVAGDRLDCDIEELPGGHLVALSEPTALAQMLLTDLEPED